MKEIYEKLSRLDVSAYTEERAGLTYLSWSHAWGELKKICPDATYTIKKFGDNQLPFIYDENTGYMVFTDMTINGITHEMWLPVMDGANKAMKDAYEYRTKYAVKTCDAADMFDINKTIMRCLVKNIAMFGLGLYIYKGEDLPEVPTDGEPTPVETPKTKKAPKKTDLVEAIVAPVVEEELITLESKQAMIKLLTEYGFDVPTTIQEIAAELETPLMELKESQKDEIIAIIEKKKGGK